MQEMLYPTSYLKSKGHRQGVRTPDRWAVLGRQRRACRSATSRPRRPLTAAQLYADLSHTGGADLAALGAKAQADPGQSAFASYAGAGRTERKMEQALLMQMILSSGSGSSGLGGFSAPQTMTSSGGGAANALFSAQLLGALSDAKHGSGHSSE